MPIQRVRKGEPIRADLINQIIDALNSFELRAAAPLQISKAVGGGLMISLGFGYDLVCVCELTENLAEGGDATAKVLWDESQAGTWAIDADTDEITVYAPTNLSGTTGDRVIAKFDRQSGLWIVLQKDC
jgi:hypothetical protein